MARSSSGSATIEGLKLLAAHGPEEAALRVVDEDVAATCNAAQQELARAQLRDRAPVSRRPVPHRTRVGLIWVLLR